MMSFLPAWTRIHSPYWIRIRIHWLTYVFADPAAECVEPAVHGAEAELAARHHHRGNGGPRVLSRVVHLQQQKDLL